MFLENLFIPICKETLLGNSLDHLLANNASDF